MSTTPSIKRSLGIAFLTQYAELVIQFVGVMILARIITSEQIGIYSVAAFLMALLHVFRDFGVAKYIIQEDHLNNERIRSAFGVAIILAWAVALVLLASSNLLADFYGEPQIRDILVVMSASFAITPVGSVLIALFRRDMELKKVAVVRIGSTVLQVLVSIGLAMAGYGAMSLAWSNFASILAFGVIAALLRNPGTPLVPRFRNMREILRFGSVASLGSVVGVAGTNSPDVIIGKAISLAATGYFSRANGLVQIFRTVVSGAVIPLVLPYFARLRRENGDITGAYHLAVTNLTAFAWPFFAVMAVLALPVVRTLYGPNWDTSVPLVQVLCAAGALTALVSLAGEVMIAHGHIKAVTQVSLVCQPVRILAILGASQFGLLAVAGAVVLSESINLVVTSRLLQRTTGVRLGGVLRASAKSAILAGCAVIGPAILMVNTGPDDHHVLTLVLGGAAAAGGWVVGALWSGHPVSDYLQHARQWFVAKLFSGK